MNTVAKNTTKHNHSNKTGESIMRNFSSLIIGASLAIAMFATTAVGDTVTVNSATDIDSSTYTWADGDSFTKQGAGKLTFDDATNVIPQKKVDNVTLEAGSVEFVNHRSMTGTLSPSAGTHIITGSGVSQLEIVLSAQGDFSYTVNRPASSTGVEVQHNRLNLGAHTLTTPDGGETEYKPLSFRLESTVSNGTFNVGNNRPVAIQSNSRAVLSGDFTKAGEGTLLIGNAKGGAVSGSFDITAGTVKVAEVGALTGETATFTIGSAGTLDVSEKTGGFTLASGQTLAGNGTVSGNMTVAGTLAPGSTGIGTLNVDELTMANNSAIDWEFENTGSYDQISGSKLVLPADGEKIALNIAGIEGFALNRDDSFTLFDGDVWLNDGSGPMAAGTDITSYFTITDSTEWSGDWKITSGSLVITAIPEPSSLLLFGLAGLALLGGLRKRK